jgi:predicted regulator of Ras-like GTPase activity (Roadblock/LC7/MglB family)
MAKREEIAQALEDLLRLEDVLACMLARKGLEGIVPSGMKIKNADLWQLIQRTTSQLFDLIERFFDYGIDRLNFELGENTIILAPVSREFALIVIIPSLANLGLLDVEIENTKRKIKTVLERKEEA